MILILGIFNQNQSITSDLNTFEILVIFGHFWPNFHVFFCLRDFGLKSRETSLANLSLVSRETVRDSATLTMMFSQLN